MSTRLRLPLARVVAATILGLLSPTIVSAAVLWTLVGTPLTAQAGVPTTFTLTATDEDALSSIGCIVVLTTSHFDVGSTAVTNGLPWSIDVTDSNTKVTVRSPTTGDALGFLQSLVFTVTATPLDSGTWSWSATAYQDINCGGSALLGVQVVAIVVSAAAPTPTPSPGSTSSPGATGAPSAAPTSAPTPAPTSPAATPGPSPASASFPAGPSASPVSRPVPTPSLAAGASPPAGASSTPTASLAPSASPVPAAAGPRGPQASPGPGSGALPGDAFTIPVASVRIDGGPGVTGVAGSTLLVLSLPMILFASPGLLLLILAVIAQATGGILWIPLVRRHLGGETDRSRARFRPRPSGPDG